MTTSHSAPTLHAPGRQARLITIDPAGHLDLVAAPPRHHFMPLIRQIAGGGITRVDLGGLCTAYVNARGRLTGHAPNPVATAVCTALTSGRPPLPLPATVVFAQSDAAGGGVHRVAQVAIFNAWYRHLRSLDRSSQPVFLPVGDDSDRFDTPAHRAAQAACVCSVRCAVAGVARRRVYDRLARRHQEENVAAISVNITLLLGRCYLQPTPLPSDIAETPRV